VEIKLPEDAFNLPLFEGYLVLDPRPAAVQNAAGAPVLWSSLAADTAAADFPAWFHANADEFCHERESPIIVLGEPGGAALAASLACFCNADPDTVVGSGSSGWSAAMIDRLRSRCNKIWLVRGGTAAIIECFPLLSASWPVEQEPTPHQVAPGLLLGSRAAPLTNPHLQRGLGVTHMIVASDKDLGEISATSVDGKSPIKLLRCDVVVLCVCISRVHCNLLQLAVVGVLSISSSPQACVGGVSLYICQVLSSSLASDLITFF
jgi:hypothetical protein